MALSQEKIAKLYANRRQKGIYEERLVELMESDEPGADAHEDWPRDFVPGGVKKSATTLYQGFNNAAKKLGIDGQIDVISRDGSVFIIVKSRVEDYEDVAGEEGDEDEEILITTSNGDGPVNA